MQLPDTLPGTASRREICRQPAGTATRPDNGQHRKRHRGPPCTSHGGPDMGYDRGKLEALRRKYGESHGGEMFDPKFQR
ncbi:MAG: hypothetical protein E5W83_33350, partial [Mesorhizobium sp.]